MSLAHPQMMSPRRASLAATFWATEYCERFPTYMIDENQHNDSVWTISPLLTFDHSWRTIENCSPPHPPTGFDDGLRKSMSFDGMEQHNSLGILCRQFVHCRQVLQNSRYNDATHPTRPALSYTYDCYCGWFAIEGSCGENCLHRCLLRRCRTNLSSFFLYDVLCWKFWPLTPLGYRRLILERWRPFTMYIDNGRICVGKHKQQWLRLIWYNQPTIEVSITWIHRHIGRWCLVFFPIRKVLVHFLPQLIDRWWWQSFIGGLQVFCIWRLL